ncbi:hypothetical protein D3C80_1726600 [compost metagenome]
MFQRRGFIGYRRPFIQGALQAEFKQFQREQLWRQCMPQILAFDGVRNNALAHLRPLHGITHRRGKNAADLTVCRDRQQPLQIVGMQARTGSIVYQNPVCVACQLQPGQHRIGTLLPALSDQHPRIAGDR